MLSSASDIPAIQSKFNRRELLAASIATVAFASPLIEQLNASEGNIGEMTQLVTLAQVTSSEKVNENLKTAQRVLSHAAADQSRWVIFPELFLSGSYNGNAFEQSEVAAAFDEIKNLCRQHRVIGLIGTGWRENGKTYNQVRIVDSKGELHSVYAKTCLTYDDARNFTSGPLNMMHELADVKFGCLICNDLWVTPGFTDGPDPRLTLQQSKQGAQVIFHSVGSGSEQRYRMYHESNLLLRAAEARCPIVTVNAFREPEVNARSGIVGTNFGYDHSLPSNREVIETVAFAPSHR